MSQAQAHLVKPFHTLYKLDIKLFQLNPSAAASLKGFHGEKMPLKIVEIACGQILPALIDGMAPQKMRPENWGSQGWNARGTKLPLSRSRWLSSPLIFLCPPPPFFFNPLSFK